MPPFVGSDYEKEALALYLAQLGGADLQEVVTRELGAQHFEDNCSFCHSEESDFALKDLAEDRSADDFYEQLGGLEEINEMMLPFEGTEEDRTALAQYLERLVSSHPKGEDP